LPIIALKYLTQLFNAVLLKGYFPAQLKIEQIFLILKPGKISNELTSYQPISLLPTVSTVFEKLFLKRLLPMVENNRLIMINEALENKHYCSEAYLDISQASDKVWHIGLLYKTVSPELFRCLKILFS
jgi:hypothetical protein